MKRLPLLAPLVLIEMLLIFTHASHSWAQSLDDIQLRKHAKHSKVGFGFLGLYETSVGLNSDRPEVGSLLFLAPQLKIGDKMRLRLNMGLIKSWLTRQDNPWDLTNFSLQFSHLGFYQEPYSKILFSGNARFYFPTSKASRNASSYGQLRLLGKASRTLGPFFLAFEFNAQKYLHKYTTWDTEENPGTSEWYHSGRLEDYIDNNSSFGFGETFTATLSTLPGLDLSLVWGMYQDRHYQPDESHGSLPPRYTTWNHAFRFVADATYGLGALPWIKESQLRDSLLAKTYVSLGYSILAPQLQNEGRDRSLNPFNPKYAQLYLDIIVLY